MNSVCVGRCTRGDLCKFRHAAGDSEANHGKQPDSALSAHELERRCVMQQLTDCCLSGVCCSYPHCSANVVRAIGSLDAEAINYTLCVEVINWFITGGGSLMLYEQSLIACFDHVG